MKKFFFGTGMEIFGKTKAVTSGFQTADGLLEGFLVGFSDAHYFTYGAHLCSQFVFYSLEFFKCPAGEFDYDIISIWYVLIQGTVFSTWNIL